MMMILLKIFACQKAMIQKRMHGDARSQVRISPGE
jgi:hypothetical protein